MRPFLLPSCSQHHSESKLRHLCIFYNRRISKDIGEMKHHDLQVRGNSKKGKQTLYYIQIKSVI